MLEVLEDADPVFLISIVVVGLALLLALAAYLLPGVRVVRSIAGVICILAAVVVLVAAFDAGPDDQTIILATMILLSALIISVRPIWKPKVPTPPAYQQAAPRQQPYPPQPQQTHQSPPGPPTQHAAAQSQPQQYEQQPQPPARRATPPPSQHGPAQQPPPGYPNSGG